MGTRGGGMGLVAWACSLVFLMSSAVNAEQYELTESEVMDIAHFNTTDVSLFGIKIGDSEAKVKQNLIKIKIPGVKVEVQDVFVDRKSTRLNSSHVSISYAVFCLKKKNKEDLIRNC